MSNEQNIVPHNLPPPPPLRMNNQENVDPEIVERPVLRRQVAGPVFPPEVHPNLDYRILPIPEEPEADPLLQINGGWDWEPRPNGLDGYTLDDFENVSRNNGWYLPPGFELEEVTDESDSEDEDEGDNSTLDAVLNNQPM
jgi:hypothetical protein